MDDEMLVKVSALQQGNREGLVSPLALLSHPLAGEQEIAQWRFGNMVLLQFPPVRAPI